MEWYIIATRVKLLDDSKQKVEQQLLLQKRKNSKIKRQQQYYNNNKFTASLLIKYTANTMECYIIATRVSKQRVEQHSQGYVQNIWRLW